jgi:hypothetical protein
VETIGSLVVVAVVEHTMEMLPEVLVAAQVVHMQVLVMVPKEELHLQLVD